MTAPAFTWKTVLAYLCFVVAALAGLLVVARPSLTQASHTVAVGGFELEASGPNHDFAESTTSFTYAVTDVSAQHALSHWVLGVCLDPLQVIDSAHTTAPFEDTRDSGDPTTGLRGIKWEVGEGFTSGSFTITVEGIFQGGIVEFALKAGQDIFIAEIEGIACDAAPPNPTDEPQPPTPTETPSSETSVTGSTPAGPETLISEVLVLPQVGAHAETGPRPWLAVVGGLAASGATLAAAAAYLARRRLA